MEKILRLEAFLDNYIWVLLGPHSNAVVVDPGDATPVLETLKLRNLNLTAILVTHHHFDHCGGVTQLLNKYNVPVYGGHREPIPHLSNPLKEGDDLKLDSIGVSFKILEIPGHTLGHIAYVCEDRKLFSGDTLFTAGCGKLFEGTPEQMLSSLSKLKALPKNIEVYCGHEYTLNNLRFAMAVEPDNTDIKERFEETKTLRGLGKSTVPASIGTELRTNPFLRTDQAAVIAAAEQYAKQKLNSETEVFRVIREWKNHF